MLLLIITCLSACVAYFQFINLLGLIQQLTNKVLNRNLNLIKKSDHRLQ